MKNQSEVARLLAQIADEYQAAQWAFSGMAAGTARHDFINHRMEGMMNCHGHLGEIVGNDEATRLMSSKLDNL